MVGRVTLEEAATHPRRNSMTRFVGMGPKLAVDVSVHRLEPGMTLLLCTDGLHQMLRYGQTLEVVQGATSMGQASSRLVTLANERVAWTTLR